MPVRDRFPSGPHATCWVEEADVVSTGEQLLDRPGISSDELVGRSEVLLYHVTKISSSPGLAIVRARVGRRLDLPTQPSVGLLSGDSERN